MVSNLYLNVDKKDITVRITIGGVLLTSWTSAQWSFDFNRPPTATIVVPNPAPGVVTFEADVTIETGFNGLTERDFTGTVLDVNPSERNCRIECQGMSKVLENTFQAVLVTVDGATTAQELVEELLADSGLAAYEVNLPAWTPGTVCPRELTFETYSEAILKIAEVDGGRWYELPTGTVRVEPRDPIPSTTSWRTYFSGVLTGMSEAYPPGVTSGRPRLRHCTRAQRARDVKNEAHVRGCTYDQTNPDGTKVAIDVEGDAMAGSPWVRKPDGTQAYSTIVFPNELIDTPVKAGTVAARLVTLWNRLLTQVTAEVDGDPQVFLGGTVRVEDPAYSGTTGNWFTEGYMTRVTDAAFTTVLTLLGGPESGFTVNICPFALFTYLVEREVMGDRLWAIVGLDGSGSVDPDGEIVSWCWEDNQDPMLISGCSDSPYWTERVDPDDITGSWLVTLITTDDQGCEDDITLPVTVAPGSSLVKVPAIFVAFDAWFSATPDGGLTWNDQTGVGVVCVSAKPDQGVDYGIGVYGTSGVAGGGELWLTDDYCATPLECVLSGVASPFADVSWDMNHPDDVWAVTEAGELYRSQANGVFGSWQLYRDLNTLPWLVPADGENVRASRIATPCCEGVWVFGGQYIDWSDAGCLVGWPLICWDAALDNHWSQAAVGGELLEDLTAYGGCTGTGSVAGPLAYQAMGDQFELMTHAPGDWTVRSTTAMSDRAVWLKNLGGILFRLDSDFTVKCPGTLQRSPDNGVTWTTVFAGDVASHEGIIDYDIAPDGRLWAVWGDVSFASAKDAKVYTSDDQGLTWDEVASFTATVSNGYFGTSITCNPNDSQDVAVLIVSGAGAMRLIYSQDRGASWTEKVTGKGTGAGNPWANQVIFGDSDRIFITRSQSPMVYHSPDWGDTWPDSLLPTGGGTATFYEILRGSVPSELFCTYVTSTDSIGKIARTIDNGDIWTAAWATHTGVGLDIHGNALAYDVTTSTLYWSAIDVDPPPDQCVMKWTAAGGWQDITDDLEAEMGSESVGQGHITAPVWAEGVGEYAGGPTDLYVREAASREAGELSIIFNSETWMTGVYYTPTIFDDGSGWQRCRDLPDKSRGRWIAPDLVPGKVVFAFDDEVTYQGNVDPVTLAMTAVVAPATLDTGPSGIDEPNHGEWIGAFNWWMPGVYLVAAEGPNQPGLVYKSWDRFETIGKLRPATGFPSAPAGARGKMIALSGTGTPESGPLAILCSGQRIYTFDGDAHWTNQADGPSSSDYRLSQTRDGHWLFINNRGETGDIWHSPDGVNFTLTLQHLTDGGYDSGVYEYDIGADGTVWAVMSNPSAHAGGDLLKPLRIYKSTTGGASWDLVYTDAGFFWSGAMRNTAGTLIAADQQNPDRVVVCCDGRFGLEPDSIYTEDGGLTWTRRINPAQPFPRGSGLYDDMRFAASGRLMFLHSQTTCSVWYSDDLGETWTQATETTAFNSPVGRQIGWWRSEWFLRNVMICDRPVAAPNSQHVKVFISPDNGATWDIVDEDDPTFEYVGWGVDYDAGRDRLVACHHYSGDPKVGAIDTPFATPAKSDITADLPAASPPRERPLAYPR